MQSKDYGPEYKAHLLEQYKLYVEMADRISSRRQSANSFFLSLNTALFPSMGYLILKSKEGCQLSVFVSLVGLFICYVWYRLIRSYKDLNTAKFKVVHELEKELPASPYDTEWDKAGRGEDSNLYLPFTHVEVAVPRIFAGIYFCLIAYLLVFYKPPV